MKRWMDKCITSRGIRMGVRADPKVPGVGVEEHQGNVCISWGPARVVCVPHVGGGRVAGRCAESPREGPGESGVEGEQVLKEALPSDHLRHEPLASSLILFLFVC